MITANAGSYAKDEAKSFVDSIIASGAARPEEAMVEAERRAVAPNQIVAANNAPKAPPPPAALGKKTSAKPLYEYGLYNPTTPSSSATNQAAPADMVARGRVAAPAVIARPQVEVMPPAYQAQGRDKFDDKPTNTVKTVSAEPVSTFSVDVDTASYSFMRSSLNNGILPSAEQVRVEELINYFPYDYEAASSKDKPFKANVSVYPTPWNADTKLMHIGIKGYELKQAEKPRSNLVFLIDTSGSMNQQNKLPMLIHSFKMMLNTLEPEDYVSIVTYAGQAGTALEPTLVKDKETIIQALENLRAGGSTAGASGIQQAYALAERHKVDKGINRVILATDGDFNVGITDTEQLKTYIEKKRETGIFLSTLGFGRGNYNDALMQTLAQHGNGNAAYIDTLSEAQKVLVEEASSTIFPIAKDVKIQVEFNPAQIAEYRLIGYETRMLNREDFNNDKIDAGDIGAGHTVTALYEMTPVGSASRMVDDLRYGKAQQPAPVADAGTSDEYAFVKMRYKLPDEDKSQLITTPVGAAAEFNSLAAAPADSRFATAVAAFGQKLRGGEYLGDFDYDAIIKAATNAKGDDPFGYRAELVNLVKLADGIDQTQ